MQEDNAPYVWVLSPTLHDQTMKDRRANAWGPPKSTYISGLDECMRSIWYARKGFARTDRGRAEWAENAETGTDMHKRYQDRMRTSGLTVKSSEVLQHAGLTIKDYPWYTQKKGLPEYAEELPVPINPLTELGGRGDNVVRLNGTYTFTLKGEKKEDPDVERSVTFDNELVVVEIKTLKPEHFRAINRKTSDKWKGFYSQIQMYLHFYKIERCILFAVCRGCNEKRELLISADPAYIQSRLERATEIKRHLDESIVPPAEGLEEGPFGKMCRFCDFKDICALEEELG